MNTFAKTITTVSIGILLLLTSFFAVSGWSEPGSSPPAESKVFLKTSSSSQTKSSSLEFTEFTDYNNPSYYLNPSGSSKFAGSLDMNSSTIKNVANPSNPQDAANKRYVDSKGGGLSGSSKVLSSGGQSLKNTVSSSTIYEAMVDASDLSDGEIILNIDGSEEFTISSGKDYSIQKVSSSIEFTATSTGSGVSGSAEVSLIDIKPDDDTAELSPY